MSAQPGDDLDRVMPQSKTLKIQGEDIEIKQFKVKQLKGVLQVVAPLYQKIKAAGPVDRQSLMNLLLTDTDEVIKMVAFLIGREVAWVEECDMEELGNLLITVLEVNFDFFIRRVLPLLSMGAVQLSVLARQAVTPGPESSKG